MLSKNPSQAMVTDDQYGDASGALGFESLSNIPTQDLPNVEQHYLLESFNGFKQWLFGVVYGSKKIDFLLGLH